LIWQGSVRTKKTISVEEKLRDALKLPLSIALPRTQDGTVIAGRNETLPLSQGEDPSLTQTRTKDGSDDGDEDGKSEPIDPSNEDKPRRRSTVVFGPTPGQDEEVVQRQRGTTIAAPGRGSVSLGTERGPLGSPIIEGKELDVDK
jgi:hypothetical protein